MRKDAGGAFWETALDVISLMDSVVGVAMNPTDVMAWVGLVADTVDLVPFITGVGEVTRAVTVTVNAADNTKDLVKSARKLYNTSDSSSAIRKMTGSYEILYESGMTYVGKGGFYRATTSAKRYADKGDTVVLIKWTSAKNRKEAFINEYHSMLKYGGPNNRTIKNSRSYNKIWGPGLALSR